MRAHPSVFENSWLALRERRERDSPPPAAPAFIHVPPLRVNKVAEAKQKWPVSYYYPTLYQHYRYFTGLLFYLLRPSSPPSLPAQPPLLTILPCFFRFRFRCCCGGPLRLTIRLCRRWAAAHPRHFAGFGSSFLLIRPPIGRCRLAGTHFDLCTVAPDWTGDSWYESGRIWYTSLEHSSRRLFNRIAVRSPSARFAAQQHFD